MERKLRWKKYSNTIWFLVDDECSEECANRASVERFDGRYIVDVKVPHELHDIATWHVIARYPLGTRMKEMKCVALNAVRLGLDTAPKEIK